MTDPYTNPTLILIVNAEILGGLFFLLVVPLHAWFTWRKKSQEEKDFFRDFCQLFVQLAALLLLHLLQVLYLDGWKWLERGWSVGVASAALIGMGLWWLGKKLRQRRMLKREML